MIISENIYFGAAIIGLLISISLLSFIFREHKANFFIGLVVLILSFEILFSWGARSGYNNSEGAFPIWLLLNYLVIPPSIWFFVKYHTDDNFKLLKWHLLLYVPAALESIIQIFTLQMSISLVNSSLWVWFSDYLPMVSLILVIGYFWKTYVQLSNNHQIKSKKSIWLSQMRFLLLMSTLSLISIFWLVFTFIGWEYFSLIEILLIVLFFGMAFLMFLDTQTVPVMTTKTDKSSEFPHFNDDRYLKELEQILSENKLYLKPNLPLKELSSEMELPHRYVSYLINKYHNKNYKEFINEYRIDTFLEKAQSGKEDHKTLLALALESGFSSKSTFNQVFKNHRGKTPSEYLN